MWLIAFHFLPVTRDDYGVANPLRLNGDAHIGHAGDRSR